MGSQTEVRGAIVDSWVEPPGAWDARSWLILQVAPLGRPRDLMLVQAAASLVPDLGWLQDLGENLCHGSPIAAIGQLNLAGEFLATSLQLVR